MDKDFDAVLQIADKRSKELMIKYKKCKLQKEELIKIGYLCGFVEASYVKSRIEKAEGA